MPVSVSIALWRPYNSQEKSSVLKRLICAVCSQECQASLRALCPLLSLPYRLTQRVWRLQSNNPIFERVLISLYMYMKCKKLTVHISFSSLSFTHTVWRVFAQLIPPSCVLFLGTQIGKRFAVSESCVAWALTVWRAAASKGLEIMIVEPVTWQGETRR